MPPELPVEMLEAAAQGLIAFDGEHPSAPWEFYAEAALEAAGVLALLEERDRLRVAIRDFRAEIRWWEGQVIVPPEALSILDVGGSE